MGEVGVKIPEKKPTSFMDSPLWHLNLALPKYFSNMYYGRTGYGVSSPSIQN